MSGNNFHAQAPQELFMIPWLHITSFGDSVVTLPAAAAIAVWLVAGRAWRMAFWWAWLFALALIVVIITKVAFLGWGIGISALDFTGIGGHAMRATAVLPVIFYLFLQRSSASVRWSGVVLGLLIGMVIGISRVMLHVHSVSETVTGCALGGLVSLGFMWLSRPLPKPHVNRWLIALSLLALLPATHAEPAPTKDWMNAVALYLSGHNLPYERIVDSSGQLVSERPRSPAWHDEDPYGHHRVVNDHERLTATPSTLPMN
jgi:membrane-associated phospholipid phosphatase